MGMQKPPRGRPRLELELRDILTAIRRHGRILLAARAFACSDAYIHGRLKEAGLTLADVLGAPSVDVLLEGLG